MSCPWDALPPHINEPHEWDGQDDDDHWYLNWRKVVKGWFAFGPRSSYPWAKWRELPITLFAVFGKGLSRWENGDGSIAIASLPKTQFFAKPWTLYLSRCQYWCNWHIQLQWPLFFAFHFKFGVTKLFNFYIGAKRDADRVYWFPAFYIGTHYK